MKNLLRVFLLLVMIPQLSFASTAQGLKDAIDEYVYAVQVEWDQKETAFVEKQENKLLIELNKLQKEGLTIEDVSEAFKLHTKLDLNEVQNEVVLLNLNSSEDVKKYLANKMHNSYMRGASWDGMPVQDIVILTLLAIGLGGALYSISKCINRTGSC